MVRKKNMYAVQAGRITGRQHVVYHLYRVVLQDTDVVQGLRVNAFEQCTHAWRVYLTAQKVCLWHDAGNVRCGLAHAKTDFKNCGRCPVKDRCKIDQRRAVSQ